MNISIEDISLLPAFLMELLRTELSSQSQGKSLLQKLYRLQGPLNLRALQDACDLVAAKNPLLRASIHWERLEKPVMVTHRAGALPITSHDWKGIPASEIQAKLQQECRLELERVFNLEKPSLLRCMLMETGEEHRFLLCTAERLVLDEHSVELLVQQIWRVYRDLAAGHDASLAMENSFRDYVKWLATQDAAGAEAFWKKNLEGIWEDGSPTVLRASSDAGLQQEIRAVTLKMSDFPLQQLIAHYGEARFHAIVYGSWVLLLRRHFGTDDVVFGVTVPGRQHSYPGAENVCGPLNFIAPFRVKVPASTPIEPWLRELEVQWQQVNRHASWGLDKIMEWSGTRQERQVFSNVVSVRLNRPLSLSDGALAIEELSAVTPPRSAMELRIAAAEGISLELAHHASFGAEAMQDLLTRFARAMNALNTERSQAPAAIQVLADDELRRLEEWSKGGTRACSHRWIQQAFQEHARQDPEAVAAIFDSETINYGELNSKANQLAAHLKGVGVAADTVVGVLMDRCLETLVAVLGILKSGGCYLPLDTELPHERLTFILQDANPAVLLTKQDHVFELPLAAAACELICLDSDWEQISTNSDEDLSPHDPEALAYIIYTSGSTGQPKGVAVPHAAVVNHLLSIREAFGYSKEDRVLQFASLSFDVSIEQMLAPLVSGATLVLKSNAPWDRSEFLSAMERFGITVANVPPAFWTQLVLDEKMPFIASPLRLMIVGGDVMSSESLRRWNQAVKGAVELLNAYGPTETVITATLFHVPSDSNQVEAQRVPIGRPLPNRRAYVANHMEIAPADFWGELLLGGDCLARGYINRPDLTAERFVPDPFNGQAGARLYRSGDIARYRADGQIEFLGRSDHQVKIRGFRIELEEIELAILEHPEVRQTAVTARNSTHGEKRLVGYVTAVEGSQLSSTDLRDFIKQKLPEYMVPSQIVFADALPLTPSGKVDRNMLSGLEEKQEISAESSSVPRNPVEQALMQIWTEVLSTSQIGIDDDFFDSGGDSLLATQVMTRTQKAFGFEAPLRLIFEFPTIAGLAAAIVEYGKASDQEIELVRIERTPDHPLSPAQERLWFLCQMGGQSEIYNMTGMIRLEGNLDLEVLERVLAEIVRRHEALRTVFPTKEDHPVQVIQPPYVIHPVLTDLSSIITSEHDEEMFRISEEEAERTFDLVHGPVFHTRLVRFSPTDHILLSTIHHIACDGWSIALLAREISVLYGAFLRKEPSPLADLPFQYVDFAHWQRQSLDYTFEGHMEYWRRRLAGSPLPVSLPQEKSGIQKVSFRGDSYSFTIPSEILKKLKTISQEMKASLFMTLLAGLKILIFSYTDCEDIVVGTDIANRTHLQTEEIIGLFVNVLALRTDLSENPTLLEAMARVREVTLEAYEHQEVPFDRIVQELNPNRTSNLTPFFKIFIDMRRLALELLQMPGLKISHLELKPRSAKFDLVLFANEAGEELECEFNYKTDLFDDKSIAHIASDYSTVLEQIAARPDMRISALQSLLERRSLKKMSNAGSA